MNRTALLTAFALLLMAAPALAQEPLRVAVAAPPDPGPGLGPDPLNRSGRPLEKAISLAVGPSVLGNRHFPAIGGSVSLGIQRVILFDDPNLPAAFPRGRLLGNEIGGEFVVRAFWLPGDHPLIQVAIRPAFRTLEAGKRFSLPSVLGLLLPAVGVSVALEDEERPPPPFGDEYTGALFRWSSAIRYILGSSSSEGIMGFVELEPSAELILPFDAAGPQATFGIDLRIGYSLVD